MRFIKILEKIHSISPLLVYRILQLNNNKIRTNNEFTDVYWQLVRDGRMLLTIREAYNIYFYLSEAIELGGAVAELGVYKGGGAKLIASFKSERPLYLFDTFEGMPEVDHRIDQHHKGDFADTSERSVRNYLSDFSKCLFYKGIFPNSTSDIPEEIKFCFVHLDVDIYESTLSGLEFFYPRMKKGGILISHDFNSISCPGVEKAFDEFFSDKAEQAEYLFDTQCIVRKL